MLGSYGFRFTFERSYAHFTGASPDEWVEFMGERYGPLHMTKRALKPDRWASLRHDLINLATATNSATDSFDASSEYLVAVGRRK